VRILITGGTGLIGQALTKTLREQGKDLLILTRQKRPAQEGVTYHTWDGQNPPKDLSPEGIEAVIHLVGASIAGRRWTAAYKEVLWHSRVEATQRLIAWLKAHQISPRFISASAVGYYGHTLSDQRCGETAPSGEDFLAGLARAWEAAANEAPSPPFIARLGVVLAQEAGALPQLLRGFRLGVGSYLAPGHQGFSWIHIQDVVRAFLWALAHPEAVGPYNVCAPQPLSARRLAEAIAQRQRTWLLLPIPRGPLYWVYGELADTLHKGMYAVPDKFSQAGFSFLFPTIEAALQDLLRT
jgi:uncharacterized protein (TIGR01777 family)